MMPNHMQSPGASRSVLTVRELVEAHPETVTASWCRQLAAHLLDDLDQREATRPHRIIMPDSVLVDAAGNAELLASPEDDAEFQPPVSVDLKAIAAVLHFAISGESPPAGPLLLRVLPAFDEQLRGAIDACLYGDRTQRPQDVAAMRALLGLPAAASAAAPAMRPVPVPVPLSVATPIAATVTVETVAEPVAGLDAPDAAPAVEPDVEPNFAPPPRPPAAAIAAPAAIPVSIAAAAAAGNTAPPPAARPLRTTRLLLACLTLVALGAAGYALYQRGRQAGAEAVLAATSASSQGTPSAAPAAAPPAAAALPAPAAEVPVQPVIDEAAPPHAASTPPASPASAPAPAQEAAAKAPPAAAAPRAAAATTTYQLRIKPWGTVYVDGVRRGISPPMKSLSLSGEHVVRIDNPGFPSRQFTVRPGKDATTRIEHDFD